MKFWNLILVSLALCSCLLAAERAVCAPKSKLLAPPATALPPAVVPTQSVLVPVTFDRAAEELGYELDNEIWERRDEFLRGIEDNLKFLGSEDAVKAYAKVASTAHNVTHERIEDSLKRLQYLLQVSRNIEEFRYSLRNDFFLFRSKGRDGKGTVLFTGYYQPTFLASRFKSAQFQYPLYSCPPDFANWSQPHPTRVQLEGYDGRGVEGGLLEGREIAYLENRFDAFMVHVQGSAILIFPDGKQTAVGFAAGTNYPFRAVPKSFLKKHNIPWNKLREYFEGHPDDLDMILSNNNRFIFFKQNRHTLPIGSIGVPVIPERSIATDKSQLPPGAVGIIHARIPTRTLEGGFEITRTTRLVIDQDTGSAIKGPGRVDIFMGTGPEARDLATSTFAEGGLYYLVLRERNKVERKRKVETFDTEAKG